MAGELSKKQVTEAKKQINTNIEIQKSNIKGMLSSYKTISGNVAGTARAYFECRDLLSKKPSDKNARKCASLEESYKLASGEYHKATAVISNALLELEREYQRLIELNREAGNMKGADKASAEFTDFREYLQTSLAKNDKSGGQAQPAPAPAPKPMQEPQPEPTTAPQSAPAPTSSGVTSVNVAPVTIDVTSIVEKAINSTIDKLNESLSKKIEEYISGVSLPEAKLDSAPLGSDVSRDKSAENVVQGVSQLMEAEGHIIDKLKYMCESVNEMLESLSSLSGTYHDIAIKQKELAELQKQINDMQRHTAREQQGVQVNQKLVSGEQIEIVAAQKLVAEKHKELKDRRSDAINSKVTETGKKESKNSKEVKEGDSSAEGSKEQ